METFPKPTIYYDGSCGLCNGFADWVSRKDRKQQFVLKPCVGQKLGSVILEDETGRHEKSKATLKILVRLGGWYRLAGIFFVVPTFIRDRVYGILSKNRYKWFGKPDACRIPGSS